MDEVFQLTYNTSVTLGDIESMTPAWRHGLLQRLIDQRKREVKSAERSRQDSLAKRRGGHGV